MGAIGPATATVLVTLAGLYGSAAGMSATPTRSVDFDAASYNVLEGNTVAVTVRLSGPPGRELDIGVDAAPAEGATVEDFEGVPVDVTFGPEDTEAVFSITAVLDAIADDGETVVLSLRDVPDDVVIGNPATATVTVVDNSESGDGVLDVLRARVTGGASFVGRPPELVKSEDGRTAQFAPSEAREAATYLAFEAQPLWGNVVGLLNVRLTRVPDASSTGAAAEGVPSPDVSIIHSAMSVEWQLGGAWSLYNFPEFGGDNMKFRWGVSVPYRLILQRVSDAQRTRRVWNVDDDLYDAHTVGARITLDERPQARRRWMPTAYLDFSYGVFQTFETAKPHQKLSGDDRALVEACLRTPTECLAGQLPAESDFEVARGKRLYIEGRVFVNRSLYLGFDLNNGPGLDVFQFSAGWTVNLDTFFGRPDG